VASHMRGVFFIISCKNDHTRKELYFCKINIGNRYAKNL
jgi:hypothetical protein